MKPFYSLFALICLSFGLHAQTVIFSENFDKFNSYIIPGWNNTLFSGAVPWRAGLLYDINSTCFPGPEYERIAGICDCATTHGGGGPNGNVLLFTPAINLTGITGAWLSFDSYFQKKTQGSKAEKATVEVSADGGSTWTVVLDVTANANMKIGEPFHVDLSAYDNKADVRIGFRFNDDGLNIGGWAIDNVSVFKPANKDMAMRLLLPKDSLQRYAEVGKGLTYSGEVYNAGLDTVTAFILNYKQNGGTVKSDTVSGISLPRFTKMAFTHSVPDTVMQTANVPVSFWVELTGDGHHGNDTMKTDIRGAYFMPVKRVTVEEGTATWNNNCPEGWVRMNEAAKNHPDASLISVHGGEWDPMEFDAYNDFLFDLDWNYIPYILFDRRHKTSGDSFEYYLNYQKECFGFASLDFDYSFGGGDIIVNAHVKPAIDMSGDFRLTLVLTEDDVSGTGSEWAQGNKFAGGAYGPMGGFEQKADTVPASDMKYNFVARAAAPSPQGGPGKLPKNLLHNTDYTQTLKIPVNAAWNKERLRMIILLVRYDDSTVLNSNKMLFYLNTDKIARTEPDIKIYPNPASSFAKAVIVADKEQDVNWMLTDITGKTIVKNKLHVTPFKETNWEIPTYNLPTGTYSVNFHGSDFRKSLKLLVIH